MSELIQKHDNRATIRWKLLTGASALALTAYVSSAAVAEAEDTSRPPLWIELSGQLSRLQNGQEVFAPPFVALTPPPFSPPQKAERPPLYGLDGSAALAFQPEGSDWRFSASIRYGRSGSSKHERHQSYPEPYRTSARGGFNSYGVTGHYVYYRYIDAFAARFTDAVTRESERHTILDFQAGKDLGLGLFGHDSSSSLNVGVRIAQFRSKSRAKLAEDPDWHIRTYVKGFHFYGTYANGYYSRYFSRRFAQQPYHSFAGTFQADRSFSGLGPSISWISSVPFAGNPRDGGLSIDWGVNAAILFGRQKTKTSHQTSGRYHEALAHGFGGATAPGTYVSFYQRSTAHTRSRNVTVPNIGAFVGMSWQYVDAKVSFGYKADFFFGAIDGGIDAAKKENRSFFGPFASISVGLGD